MNDFRPRLRKDLDNEVIMEFLKQISAEDFVNLVDSYKNGLDVNQKIDVDLIERKFKSELSRTKREYNTLLNQHNLLDEHYNNMLAVDSQTVEISKIKADDSNKKGSAIAFTQWSDWHIDEVVDPRKITQGFNEYTPEIARKRSRNLARNLMKLVYKERQSVDIDTLVIHLGGDFIGGWIHPELEQTNSMSPIEATIYAEELIGDCLSHVLESGNFSKIICVCNVGNHGRNTQKMQIGNQLETNYETLIYTKLNKTFSDIDFVIPGGDLTYLDVFDQKIRFIHGHQIRYGGGVGGMTIPLNKAQSKWDSSLKADYNFMGHFHQLSYPNGKTTLNGSLKGYDSYAQTIGAAFQVPQQSFGLLDSKRGWTIKAPIFTD